MTQNLKKKIQTGISVIFFLVVTGLVMWHWGISLPGLSFSRVLELSSSRHQGFHLPNFRIDPVREYLPTRGRISMITDHPYEVGINEEELFYRAQNFLAPVIINRKAEEKLALIVCTTPEIADRRVKETGYTWIKNFNNGKGVATNLP